MRNFLHRTCNQKIHVVVMQNNGKEMYNKKCVCFVVVVVAIRPNNFLAVLVAGTVWLIWSCPITSPCVDLIFIHPQARPGTFKTNMDEK